MNPGEHSGLWLQELPEELRVSIEADSRRVFTGEAVTRERRQNWLKNGHTSDGIHDIVFPESVGDGVWGPS